MRPATSAASAKPKDMQMSWAGITNSDGYFWKQQLPPLRLDRKLVDLDQPRLESLPNDDSLVNDDTLWSSPHG
jgi:hypothetical protein